MICTNNEDWYCKDCAETELYICEDCNDYFADDDVEYIDGKYLCSDCLEHDYCEDCDDCNDDEEK